MPPAPRITTFLPAMQFGYSIEQARHEARAIGVVADETGMIPRDHIDAADGLGRPVEPIEKRADLVLETGARAAAEIDGLVAQARKISATFFGSPIMKQLR